ncbi:NAD(P)/FAD-dependent oxidoreductase [Jiangella anatolica]|uniref:FAD-dependent oxidoreductase n=1 Tax=Jiangella anatolica TaxID=2670374 RepID=A0A2W2B7H1_9ACTN|nr:FAD-dependent oxidoreductase [Jiangella anatolica]PZF83411.1 FAD-dependent oxidoreductase [Jiangella anatolica]
MTETNGSRPSVVVVGGGFAGIHAAKALDEVADVTLVDPSDTFLHNLASWRALVQPEWLDRIFLPYDRLLAHGRFVRDRAVDADGTGVTLASGERLAADYVILATGSSYPFPAKTDETDVDVARSRFLAAHHALHASASALVIGAGAAGLELAGEIKTAYPDKDVTLVDLADDILPGPYDQELRTELRRQLDGFGVRLVLGSPLRALPDTPAATAAPVTVTTEAGDELSADIWFRAFGVTPATGFVTGSLANARDDQGYLRVDDQLRVVGHENVYAIGDIGDADRNMAATARLQAQLVAANLVARITGAGEVTGYEKLPPMVAIPLGPEGGAGQLPGIEGLAGPDVIAQVKGRSMLMEAYDDLFNVEPAA